MKKILLLATAMSGLLMADTFGTAPGTKARAMSGAFTAISNNTSALYFNPAGLIAWEDGSNEYNTVTLEVGTAIKLDVQKGRTSNGGNGNSDFIDSYTNYFLGAASFGKDSGWAMGIYSLNSFNNPYIGTSDYYLQENTVMSAGYAYKLTDSLYSNGGKISIGATIGYAFTGQLSSSDAASTSKNVEAQSFQWSIGLKARLYTSDNVNVDLGVNYRAATDYEPSSEYDTIIPWNIPEETALGFAVTMPTENTNITMSYDYKKASYEEATKYVAGTIGYVYLGGFSDVTTHSIGTEVAFESFQLRAGYNMDSNEGNAVDYANDFESNGYSVGVGYTAGNWNLEIAGENKNIKTSYVSTIDTTNTFYSMSANYAY